MSKLIVIAAMVANVVFTVMVADIVPPGVNDSGMTLPEITLEEIETTTISETKPLSVETHPQTVSSEYSDGFAHYSVNGITPPIEWQRYLYDLLSDRGIEWFYPFAVCQIYQESNWSRWSDNGRDKGLCQQKAIYWAARAEQAGIPGADIWDPYAQLLVYTWMMSEYLRATGYDVNQALSMYYTGTWEYSETYVGHVMRWLDYLEVVE